MNNSDGKALVLAGDIGGTKTNMGLFVMGKTRPVLKEIETYSSRKARGLENIIEAFIQKYPRPISNACFGIAGPVVSGQCKTTNLPWVVSEGRLKRSFKWPKVRLINDLSATVLSIPLLSPGEAVSLNTAKAKKGQNIGLIAPGTGLGEALLIFRNGRHIPIASEGGHADFSPNTQAEARLWAFLHSRLGHVSVERVLSGPGLLNIYLWLKNSGKFSAPPELRKMMTVMDPARVISEAAMNGKEPLCVETLNMFASILGAAAGNLALTGITTGGLYLGGGIPPKILPFLKTDRFINAFTAKGRFKDMLNKIPVRVILNERAALLGAAWEAFKGLDGIKP